jgi:hypothetical protein
VLKARLSPGFCSRIEPTAVGEAAVQHCKQLCQAQKGSANG